MEEKILPETDVAELELEAVIGFNGEASSIRDTSGAVRRWLGSTWEAVGTVVRAWPGTTSPGMMKDLGLTPEPQKLEWDNSSDKTPHPGTKCA